jgi:hypothetical protein
MIVLHSDDLARECQLFFSQSTCTFSFEAAQVYISMRRKRTGTSLKSYEEEDLCWHMRNRLCQSNVYESEEGCLIRIALALKRAMVLMRIQNDQILKIDSTEAPEQNVIFSAFHPMFSALLKPTGTYTIDILIPGRSAVIPKTGTIVELSRTFRFFG